MVGGLIVSQALTLYTTPVIYLYLDQFSRWLSGAARARQADDPNGPRADLVSVE